jgi:hypothetical protein
MPVHRLKRNFTSGEVSPLLGSRVDLDRFNNGCKTLLNAYSKAQGPATRRSGFEFVYNLGRYTDLNLSQRPRIVPFVFGETQSFVLIFVPLQGLPEYVIYVANSGGIILDGGGNPVTVSTAPGTSAISTADADFQWVQIGDIINIAFKSGNRAPVEIRREDVPGTQWVLADTVFDYLPQKPGGDFETDCDIDASDIDNAVDCAEFNGTWEIPCTNISYTWTRKECRDRGGKFTQRCKDPVLDTKTKCEAVSGTWSASWDGYKTVTTCKKWKIQNSTDCSTYGGTWIVRCAGWKAKDQTDCTGTLGGTWGPGNCAGFVIDHKDDCEDFGGTWSGEGSDPWWNDEDGWPATVSAYQQRVAYGGTTVRPQTVWLSRIQSLLDFNTNIDEILTQDQALAFTLASGDQNRIQWLASSRSLITGTYGDEWTIDGGPYEAITPTNVVALRQTNHGCERLPPILVGPSAIFLERLGRTVQEMVYDFNMNSYKSNDLTILAPHITKEYSIFDWAYQRTPNSVVWSLRDDGTLLGLTYQREQKVVGWHRHETEGFFISVGSTPGQDRETDLWVVVAREDKSGGGTGGYWCLEKMAPEFVSDDILDSRFLDSYTVYTNPGTDTFTIPHLEGHTVNILADGETQPPQVAAAGGVITLDKSTYGIVVIGLPYITVIEPVMADIPTPTGTSMGRTQRITRVDVRLHNTMGLEIGNGKREPEEVPLRHPADDVGGAVPLFSEIIQRDFPEGYDEESTIVIQQTKPLPLTVIGVTDTVEVYD